MSAEINAVICAVCLDIFDQPRMLNGCGHSACLRCLIRLVTLANDDDEATSIRCPECRVVTKFSVRPGASLVDLIHRLKPNIAVQRVAEFMKKTSKRNAESSSALSCAHLSILDPGSNVYCQHCKVTFCSSCLMKHVDSIRIELAWAAAGFAKRNVKEDNESDEPLFEKAMDLCHTPLIHLNHDAFFELWRLIELRDSQLVTQENDVLKYGLRLRDIDNIHLVADTGNVELLNELIEIRKSLPKPWYRAIAEKLSRIDNEKYPTALLKSAANGHSNILSVLLNTFNVTSNGNALDRDRSTPLHLAAANGHLNVAKVLIETNGQQSIITLGTANTTPFDVACRHGHLEIIEYFHSFSEVQEKIEESREDATEPPGIIEAAKNGQIEIVKFFIETLGFPVLIEDSDSPQPLHEATEYGHLNIVKYLLERDPEILDEPDLHGDSALFISIRQGHTEMFKYLLNVNESHLVESRNGFGRTPLLEAVAYCQYEIVKHLLTRGADLSARGGEKDDGRTCLHLAISPCCEPDMLELLLSYGESFKLLQVTTAKSKISPLKEATNLSARWPEKSNRFVQLLKSRGAVQ